MKSRYIYPAIITKEDELFNVSFPDIDNCFTFGEDLEDTLDSAKDVLQLMLFELEEENKEIPKSTKIEDIKTKDGEYLTLIDVWMVPFRDKMRNTSIKKTITIPRWLNEIGIEKEINFSQVMQSAIKDLAGIKE